ncbi:hypothetical protein LPTSP4_18190 [Leptospira ryugenii]|uniref:Bacteriocin-protection protein, YdeI/OmpD-associated family n=1 Tax=Leptospira ryugenii TaxID=1917863 RepID=A0A2P2E080_9LEPT|nr:YdeI/OmpD-associated family protein [Leptospira ryugenii]GBF50294.1 hypothetical protein LPTSP4_18190 [Leptospira ryugenii]
MAQKVRSNETFQPHSIQELRRWFEKNLDREEGIWIILAKKNSGIETIRVDDLIDECLCFGWIDSLPNKIDEKTYKLYISPRSPKSNWSLVNKEKVKRLEKEGRIHAKGKAMIQIAKKTGTWTALEGVDNLEIPSDLLKELEKYKQAKANFLAFPKSVRRGILEWIGNAKKEETRKNRISETASLAEQNVRANQYQKPNS